MEILKVLKMNEKATLPTRGTDQSAGLDLYACLEEPLCMEPMARALIPTGVAVALPTGTAGMIYARSGLAVKHGLTLSNSVGVVDSDYRGEIRVGLVNLSKEAYTIQPNERIAQLVVTPVLLPQVEEADSLDETVRGAGGFGSTGRN